MSGFREDHQAPSWSLAQRRELWFYLLISPWLIGFLFLQVVPIGGVFLLSLVDWPLPAPPRLIGLSNFGSVLQDPVFAQTLYNTGYFVLGTVPPGLALGLGLALLTNRRATGMSVFRAIYLLPAVISGVATALVWSWVFNPQYGFLNGLLAQVGMRGPAWLQDETWSMPALILVQLWTAGINMVIYLAALQGIPRELHEAAAIDGADRWRRFWSITWPFLSPVTFYLLIVNIIGSFQVFTPMYILTGGGPNNATMTLPLYIYYNAFSWGHLGYASAMAVFLFLIILVLTLVLFRLAAHRIYYIWAQV